jgi:ferrous iron transport protein B
VLLSPVLGSIGLPPELSIVFLAGFFRRDYGAAGLFDLYRQGALHGGQLLVAAVVMTLFLPCLAQLAVMFRERKLPGTMVILAGVALITFCVGLLLRIVLGLPQI